MKNNNKNLEILDTGKTVVFTTPLSGYDNYLVRTGIIKENNSFIHSIMTAYSKEYFYMDIKGKQQLSEKFIENIYKLKEFKREENNFEKYKSKLLEFVNNIYNLKEELSDKKLKKIYKHISKNPVYNLLFEIISYDDIVKMFSISDNNIFDKYKVVINHEIKNYLESLEVLKHIKDKTKCEFIKKNIITIINLILDEIEIYIFINYKKELMDDINVKIVNIISNKLKTDIYFIDSKNRLPYIYNTSQIYKNKNAIIVLKIENTYETIGLLLDDNKVKRTFDTNHFLIKKINTFLFEKNKIPTRYPDLLNYIKHPTKHVKNKKYNIEEDSEDGHKDEDKNSVKDSDEDSDKDSDKDCNEDSDEDGNKDIDSNEDDNEDDNEVDE